MSELACSTTIHALEIRCSQRIIREQPVIRWCARSRLGAALPALRAWDDDRLPTVHCAESRPNDQDGGRKLQLLLAVVISCPFVADGPCR